MQKIHAYVANAKQSVAKQNTNKNVNNFFKNVV